MEKVVGQAVELSASTDEKYGLKTPFLLFNIKEVEKKVCWGASFPLEQANPFPYSCSFTLHMSQHWILAW